MTQESIAYRIIAITASLSQYHVIAIVPLRHPAIASSYHRIIAIKLWRLLRIIVIALLHYSYMYIVIALSFIVIASSH